MHEVSEQKKTLLELIEELRLAVEDHEVDGVVVVSYNARTKDMGYQMSLGSPSNFEWIGALDVAKDMLKGDFAAV